MESALCLFIVFTCLVLSLMFSFCCSRVHQLLMSLLLYQSSSIHYVLSTLLFSCSSFLPHSLFITFIRLMFSLSSYLPSLPFHHGPRVSRHFSPVYHSYLSTVLSTFIRFLRVGSLPRRFIMSFLLHAAFDVSLLIASLINSFCLRIIYSCLRILIYSV